MDVKFTLRIENKDYSAPLPQRICIGDVAVTLYGKTEVIEMVIAKLKELGEII